MSVEIRENYRETVVYHQVSEETPLVGRKVTTSTFGVSEKCLAARQKKIYSAITLADIFNKIVHTTIVTTFVLYAIQYLKSHYEHSLVMFFIFTSVTWFTTAIVNLVAEYFMNSRNAILVGFSIYFVGTAFLSGLSAHMVGHRSLRYLVIAPLFFVCIGEGLCKAFIGEFGHIQFVSERIMDQLRSYSTKLYWSSHFSALIMIAILLATIESANYEIGVGLCCVCLVLGFLCFCMGWNGFKVPFRSKTNVFKLIYMITTEAKRLRKVHRDDISSSTPAREPNHWLDYAKVSCGGSHSEQEVIEAKSFYKTFVLFLTLIPYWVCNAQAYSTFIYQGFHLQKKLGSVTIPTSWVALINIVSVLVFVKVLEKLILPCLRRRGYIFSTTWRLSLGMVAVAFSMCCAGGIQLYAHSTFDDNNVACGRIDDMNLTCSKVHILWTVPQYIGLGISEVLVGLTGLSLACKLCPTVFKKLIVSVYYTVVAIGNVISLVVIGWGWFPKDHYFASYEMVIYFFGLAGFAMLGLFLLLCVTSRQQKASETALVVVKGSPTQAREYEDTSFGAS